MNFDPSSHVDKQGKWLTCRPFDVALRETREVLKFADFGAGKNLTSSWVGRGCFVLRTD